MAYNKSDCVVACRNYHWNYIHVLGMPYCVCACYNSSSSKPMTVTKKESDGTLMLILTTLYEEPACSIECSIESLQFIPSLTLPRSVRLTHENLPRSLEVRRVKCWQICTFSRCSCGAPARRHNSCRRRIGMSNLALVTRRLIENRHHSYTEWPSSGCTTPPRTHTYFRTLQRIGWTPWTAAPLPSRLAAPETKKERGAERNLQHLLSFPWLQGFFINLSLLHTFSCGHFSLTLTASSTFLLLYSKEIPYQPCLGHSCRVSYSNKNKE